MKYETMLLAEHGGFYDCQKAAAILLREVEMDCARREDEDGFLRTIIAQAKTFAARMAFAMGKGNANNRRKFAAAIDEYVAATGLAIVM